jgi:hypothetical protein
MIEAYVQANIFRFWKASALFDALKMGHDRACPYLNRASAVPACG